MILTIKNIENISGAKLPNLDGWTIGYIQDKGHIYEIDIQHIHTLKMVLHVNRENPYVDRWNKDNYTCTLLGANGSKYKWELHRNDFKTKLGFIKCVGEMVLKLQSAAEAGYAYTPNVSAGTHITQSISTLHAQIQKKNGF